MSDAELAAQLGLLTLDRMGPLRLAWLTATRSPAQVLAHLRVGELPPEVGPRPTGVSYELVQKWIAASRDLDEAGLLRTYVEHGIEIITPDSPGWPFADDLEPPALVFAEGQLDLLARRPTVAVVGTRRCSTIGRRVARSFGAELAEAGVTVVSGLAAGIDGAAHEGVLGTGRAAAVAVVGSGLDVVYPKVNAHLWQRLAGDGLLVSEAALGSRPERWRFPARNRLIAALADVVVVVESHAAGGSLLTVGEAADRGVPVMAVPGSVISPASSGSNQLLAEGVPPACTTQDILDVLPLQHQASRAEGGSIPSSHDLSTLAAAILADADAGAVHIDDLLDGHRVPIPELLAAVSELERSGLAELDGSTLLTQRQGLG